MSKRGILHKVGRILKWVSLSIVAILILVPVLLYLPPVQEFAKNIAINQIEQSTGMDVSLSRLRLRFPLRVELQGLNMALKGDTMIAARRATLDVALLPLLKSRIEVKKAELDKAQYQLNTPDSAVYLKAKIDYLSSAGTDLSFNLARIAVGETVLDGADVSLILRDTITAPTPEPEPSRMIIDAPSIKLRNVRFHMSMLPTIDTLDVDIGEALLSDGRIDMYSHKIDVKSLTVDSLTAQYFTPSADFLESYVPPKVPDSILAADSVAVTAPWTIKAAHLAIQNSAAIYATRGVIPTAGFDPQYISVTDVNIEVDSFYNRATDLSVPITLLSVSERCGLSLNALGVFSMDSTLMRASEFMISTPNSSVLANAVLGVGDMTVDPNIPVELKANGKISVADLLLFSPLLKPTLGAISPSTFVEVNTDIAGRTGLLDIHRLSLSIPDALRLNANGRIANAMDFDHIAGHIDIDGALTAPGTIRPLILAGISPKEIDIASMAIKGGIDYKPGVANGKIQVVSGAGRMAFDGMWQQRNEGYDASMKINSFPFQKFLPSLGISDITADADIRGHGYDPSSRSTAIDAFVKLDHLTYQGQTLRNITLDAKLDTCRLDATAISANTSADLQAHITAWFSADGYKWNLQSAIRNIDLTALGFSTTPMGGAADITSFGSIIPKTMAINATIDVDKLNWLLDDQYLSTPHASMTINASDSLTQASVVTEDFDAKFCAAVGIDTLLAKFTNVTDLLNRQIDNKKADVEALQHALPPLHLEARSGNANMIARYLNATSDIGYRDASLILRNDSLISMQANVEGFASGQTRLDNIAFTANQHGRFLVYDAKVDNRPGTMDDFAHVSLSGFISADKFSAMLRQQNIQGAQGFNIGFNATLSDSTITVNIVPFTPTIAYKNWTVNRDNFVEYNYLHQHLDANLRLMSDASSLLLYTEHDKTVLAALDHQEDVVLKLNNINLAEWMSISPFAPPIKGDVDADMRFRWNGSQLTGQGNVDLNEFYYGRERVGSFRLGLDLANDASTGAIRANASLMIDNVKVITASGNLNDSTAVHPFLLDFSMVHLPLRVVNPFLPKDMAQLSGMLNGRMNITGDLANPIFNGFLDFDSTAVKVGMMGSSYKFSEEKIPVDSNVVRFNDFVISGLNDNGLHINGNVDARHVSDIKIDLSARARDMMIVNSQRPRGANVYGKAYVDLDAHVKGGLRFIDVDANLNLLAGTNVTYVMTDAQSTLTSRRDDSMVKFVQFADTAQVLKADSLTTPSMLMNLNAVVKLSDGNTINVDISPDGKNKASINAVGMLTYSQTPMSTDGRLTGRITINKGFVRYTPPMMSEKNFKFDEGSTIVFTGDMLNPTLNLRAVDRLKANVTQTGQNSRLVNFDVILSVTNTLENMNVAFDLSTNDDITIENELSSMSPEQRANQAMNMLLYNIYTGPGTKGNANISGNPLYQFLTSQVNSWAANNIRGVDISFGIDQYDKTTDGNSQTATSYSYRVSKSLFNDRFKIVVGGNYSTDADADENLEQNLINDISFEYMLNRSGSMYVRLFRHVGYESILEGEITQTGVGFVMKRKVNSLRNIFRFRNRRRTRNLPETTITTTPTDESAH